MTPHEVMARCAELGTHIVQSTLANYKSWGLIHPPVVQSLGRKIGKVSTYRDDAPLEVYTAQRLSGRDFGFSLDYVCLFRLHWLSDLETLATGQPLDLFVEGGALLWGLIYNTAKLKAPLAGQFMAFFYPPERLDEIVTYVRSQEPDSLLKDLSSPEEKEKLRGLVLLRRKGDGHHILALMHDHGARVLTCLGTLPEGVSVE
jgi:hypothetical protein